LDEASGAADAAAAAYHRRGAPRAIQIVAFYKKTPFFFEFSLCLSRACLGKMLIFSIKWRKNGVFYLTLIVEQLHRRHGRNKRLARSAKRRLDLPHARPPAWVRRVLVE
jgi:hypothetical protein